jgi:hypothetical protein
MLFTIYPGRTMVNKTEIITIRLSKPELNKDILLDLSEKHYENLVEALTNNAIGSASYSNSTLPLSSSSTLVGEYKSDPYRIEESEIFRNSKGDIAG